MEFSFAFLSLFRNFALKIPLTVMIQIRCKNTGVTKSFQEGTSLLDIYQEFKDDIQLPYPVVSAKVNNVSQGLKYRAFQSRDVEFLDASEGRGTASTSGRCRSCSTRRHRTFSRVPSCSSSTRCRVVSTVTSSPRCARTKAACKVRTRHGRRGAG